MKLENQAVEPARPLLQNRWERFSLYWTRSQPWGYYLAVFLFFLVLVIFYTWPVGVQFDRTLPGNFTDQEQNLWSLWWVKRAVLDLHTGPFFTSYLYYPYGVSLYLHALAPLLGLFTLPLTATIGPIVSYNVAALLGLTLTGVCGSALGRTISGSAWGGLAAGYIIAFGPIHFSYLSLGQIEFMNLWPLLLYLTFLVRLLDSPLAGSNSITKPGQWWLVAGAASSLGLGALVTLYYAAYAILFTGLYLLFRALQERRWPWLRNALIRLGGVALLLTLGLGYLAWQVWQAEKTGGVKIAVKPNVIFNESVTIQGYLADFDGNILLGKLLGLARTAAYNRVHYLGLGALALAGLGLYFWKDRRSQSEAGEAKKNRGGLWRSWPWLALALFFALASFGPTVRTDPNLNAAIGPTQPWLPWNWIQLVPLVNITHSPTRLALLVLVAVAVLAAQGIAFLLEWFKNCSKPGLKLARVGIILVVIVILGLEGPAWPALNRTPGLPPQASVIQADCGKNGCEGVAVMDLPILMDNYLRDSPKMLYGSLRQLPIVGGYLSREVVNPYLSDSSPFRLFIRPGEPGLDLTPAPAPASLLALLNRLNIRYLTVNGGDFDLIYAMSLGQVRTNLEKLLGISLSAGNNRLYGDGNIEIYKVPPTPVGSGPLPPLLFPTNGWLQVEKEEGGVKRWSGGRAAIGIYSFAGSETTASLTFEAVSFNQPRHVRVTLNGQPVGSARLEMGADGFNEYRLDTLKLQPGENALALEAQEPPQSPADLDPASKDTRKLSLALRNVRLQVGG